MKIKTVVIIISIIIVLTLMGVIQFTGDATIGGLSIKIPFLLNLNKPSEVVIHTGPEITRINPEDFKVKIESVKSIKEIYKPNEIAYVDIKLENNMKVPYNISVDWIFNEKRHHGWNNVSTNFYNVTDKFNYLNAWYLVNEEGDWVVEVTVDYVYRNISLVEQKIVSFRVV